MPPRYTPCTEPGCPELHDKRIGDCSAGHAKAKRKAAQQHTDSLRPTARQRGYDTTHERTFRAVVLRRDPTCVLCMDKPSKHADHWPTTRAQLVARGLDPNNPACGRGLCASCHASHTATSDGGFGNPMHATA